MSVEDYILNGICEGCDQDPAKCHLQGYCEYDGLNSGDKVYQIIEAKSSENQIKVLIQKRIINKKVADTRNYYWLLTLDGNKAGSAPINDLFITRHDAIEEAMKRI